MKNGLRKLVPAGAVGVVLALSYFAPVFGVEPTGVKSTVPVPCGRFGGGYSGGKHLTVCVNVGGNGAPENSASASSGSGPSTGSTGGLAAIASSGGGRPAATSPDATGGAKASTAAGALQGNAVLTADRLAQSGQPLGGSNSLPLALGLSLIAIVSAGGVLVLTRRRNE